MFCSGIWHFVYRHLVVWQTCLTVCNCVAGTDILSGTLRRAEKTSRLGLGWVIFLRDSVKTSSLHSINPAPPSNSLHRAHTPFNLLLPFNSLLHLHAVTGNVGDGFTCSRAGSRRGLLCHSSSRSDDVGFQMDGFQTKKGGLSGYYGDGGNVNATGSSRTQSDGVRLPVITPGLRAHFKPHTRTLIHTSAPLL